LEIQRATLDTCAQATGTVVVIDVLRAFTTAAYAFAAGAADITLVGATEEAFALRERNPDHPGPARRDRRRRLLHVRWG
jgi:2-phosphosulfolactate phosphatase